MLRAGYDFSSPFMTAAILTENGDRIPLWTADRALRNPDGTGPFMVELVVKLTLANIPIITARLTPPYDDGIRFLDSELIEWGTSKLEAQLGYSTGSQGAVLSPVYSGILLKPDIQIGGDISITLNAQGLSTFNLPSQTGLRLLHGTRKAIVERLLRGPDPQNPRTVRIDDSEMATAPEEARAGWFTNVIEVQQGGISDWQWIQTLVWECRASFLVVGDTLRVFSRDARAVAVPKKLFAVYDYPEGRLGPGASPIPVYPVLSASSPSMGIYLPGYLRGSVLNVVNPATRAVTQQVVDDTTTRAGRTGRGGVNQSPSPANPGANPQADGLEVFPSQSADARAREQMNAAHLDFAQRAGIRLELETVGVPDILPGETIGVRGLGRRIDGPNYMVFDVTHTAGGSGYTTRLVAYANVSETWLRALPAEGQVPARSPASSLLPTQERIEVFSSTQAPSSGLPGDV